LEFQRRLHHLDHGAVANRMSDGGAVFQRIRPGGHAGDADALAGFGTERIDLPDQLVVLTLSGGFGTLEFEFLGKRLRDGHIGQHHVREVRDFDEVGERCVQTYLLRHGLVDLDDAVVHSRVGHRQRVGAVLIDSHEVGSDRDFFAVGRCRGGNRRGYRLEVFHGGGDDFGLGFGRFCRGFRFDVEATRCFLLGGKLRVNLLDFDRLGLSSGRHGQRGSEVFVPEVAAARSGHGGSGLTAALCAVRNLTSGQKHGTDKKRYRQHLLHHTAPFKPSSLPVATGAARIRISVESPRSVEEVDPAKWPTLPA